MWKMDVLLISQYKHKYGFSWKSLGGIRSQMKSMGRICFILFVERVRGWRGISSPSNEEEGLVFPEERITSAALADPHQHGDLGRSLLTPA